MGKIEYQTNTILGVRVRPNMDLTLGDCSFVEAGRVIAGEQLPHFVWTNPVLMMLHHEQRQVHQRQFLLVAVWGGAKIRLKFFEQTNNNNNNNKKQNNNNLIDDVAFSQRGGPQRLLWAFWTMSAHVANVKRQNLA